jgi:PRTRC genetic system protein E
MPRIAVKKLVVIQLSARQVANTFRLPETYLAVNHEPLGDCTSMPMSDGENAALTTLMSFTGTATELDDQLPNAIASFVASHLELKNTLARAREEMDAAAKAA